jgi:hypothetical protein
MISGDYAPPIDFNLEFGIEIPLSLLMKSSALELILIAHRAGFGVDCILEDGWTTIHIAEQERQSRFAEF